MSMNSYLGAELCLRDGINFLVKTINIVKTDYSLILINIVKTHQNN